MQQSYHEGESAYTVKSSRSCKEHGSRVWMKELRAQHSNVEAMPVRPQLTLLLLCRRPFHACQDAQTWWSVPMASLAQQTTW